MKVYVFGNSDLAQDSSALKAAKEIVEKDVEFVTVDPNQDLPFADEKSAILMDTIEGIEQVELIKGEDLDRLLLSPRVSVHDFDLGFQLKYLKKINKLGEVKIIGLPIKTKIDHLRIHSILRKLVAQDIQGS
jgi:Ni,Fe-hydrogenase maturation factor